jgi:AcrR family transcriptional regulator
MTIKVIMVIEVIMPRAFNEEEKKFIRLRLIEAGKRSINRAGIKALVVDDVARDAGISKGSFYSFFPSREDFILSVFEAWEIEYRGDLIRRISEGQGTARERLARFFIGAFEIIDKEPGLCHLAYKDIERLIECLPPERIAAHQANDERVLERTFADWAGRGLIDSGILDALPGIASALFTIAIHKDDFPPGSYEPATKLIAEALAMRIAPEGRGEGDES